MICVGKFHFPIVKKKFFKKNLRKRCIFYTMDNGPGRHAMAETVYGTEDSTMVMSEKVIC